MLPQRHTLVNHFLEYSAQMYPEKEALIFRSRRLTYSELDEASSKCAHAFLELGIKKGDRIAVFMENSAEAVISIFAALKSSAVFVMINHSTKKDKLQYLLNNCNAKLLIADSHKIDVLKRIDCPSVRHIFITGSSIDRSLGLSLDEIIQSELNENVVSVCIDRDLATIIYTSGSTGDPKGVMMSHQNMISAAHSITSYLQNSDKDIILNMLPLSFDYGMYQIFLGFAVGATVILENPSCFPYQLVNIIQREKVTGLPGMPMIFAMLLMLKDISKFDLTSLRYITNTAVPLPENHIKRLKRLFPHTNIYSMYGLTECKRVSYLSPDQIEKRPDSVGKPMPNVEAYIVNKKGEKVRPGEMGELVVRGSNVMLGYWGMPEESDRCLRPGRYPGERVLYTGDFFTMDDEDYLYFVRRKDDMIKCRGEKVSPREIEEVISGLDGVKEVAVVGVDDHIMGHAIKAYVVKDKESELKIEKVQNHCAKILENTKMPRYIEFKKTLPRTGSGKIDKSRITFNTLHDFLIEHARRTPDKIAVIQNERKVTYKELKEKALRLASYLNNKGIQRGDRVAILTENSPEYIVSYFSVLMSGGITVEINTQYSPYEVQKIVNNCNPKMMIVDRRYYKLIKDILKQETSIRSLVTIESQQIFPIQREIEQLINNFEIDVMSLNDIVSNDCDFQSLPHVFGNDIASIIYTSGTTGEPKGVMLSHDNFVSNSHSIIESLRLESNEKVMVILPFYYSYGKSLLNTHIMLAGTLILENSFMYPNVILDTMLKEEVTGFAGVPSTFAILLNRSNIRNYSFPSLRYVTQAGGPMAPIHAKELAGILSRTDIFIMYGQTEASPRLTCLPPEDLFRKRGSIGKAIPGVTIELRKENGDIASTGEEGEIVAEGQNIMIGYWNNQEETEKVLRGNKLYTGDIATIDAEGYLYIVGRRSDMIKSGAHRISPKEIEEIILGMHEVHEVVAVGVDDEMLGQAVKAIVVLKDEHKLEPKAIIKYCKIRLAQFKVPKEVVFIDELPKTSSGKVRRHLCSELTQETCFTR